MELAISAFAMLHTREGVIGGGALADASLTIAGDSCLHLSGDSLTLAYYYLHIQYQHMVYVLLASIAVLFIQSSAFVRSSAEYNIFP